MPLISDKQRGRFFSTKTTKINKCAMARKIKWPDIYGIYVSNGAEIEFVELSSTRGKKKP